MYEQFKKQWMKYAKEIKLLLDVYHEPQHKLHREQIWPGFYQYHKSINYNTNKDSLFNYYSNTHFQNMFERHKLDITQQKTNFINDFIIMFKEFGYNDDPLHRFYGNYYRDFVEREEDDTSHEDDDDDDSFVDTSDDDDNSLVSTSDDDD
eukprot:111871_1